MAHETEAAPPPYANDVAADAVDGDDDGTPDEPTFEVIARGFPIITLPASLLSLSSLSDVLNEDVWKNVLSDRDRARLSKLLPQTTAKSSAAAAAAAEGTAAAAAAAAAAEGTAAEGAAAGEAAAAGGADAAEQQQVGNDDASIRDDPTLAKLFDESQCFHFGNPLCDTLRQMKGGRFHPKVAEYFEAQKLLQRRQHVHVVRNYHDNFVRRCMELRDVFVSCGRTATPVDAKIKRWQVYRGLAPPPALKAENGNGEVPNDGTTSADDDKQQPQQFIPSLSAEELTIANAYELEYYRRQEKRRRVSYDPPPPAPVLDAPAPARRSSVEPSMPRNLVSAVLRAVTAANNKARVAELVDEETEGADKNAGLRATELRKLRHKTPEIPVKDLYPYLEEDDALVREAQKKGQVVNVEKYLLDVLAWLSRPSDVKPDGYSSGGGLEVVYYSSRRTVRRRVIPTNQAPAPGEKGFRDVRDREKAFRMYFEQLPEGGGAAADAEGGGADDDVDDDNDDDENEGDGGGGDSDAARAESADPTPQAQRGYSAEGTRISTSRPALLPSTSDEVAKFREFETRRYEAPTKPFQYERRATDGGGSAMVACAVRPGEDEALSKKSSRAHPILVNKRPAYVTIVTVVRDACARLPEGYGSRADICTLVRDSQYVLADVSDKAITSAVSGGLDRLHYEGDPCVRYDTSRRIWVYLHAKRSEDDFKDVPNPGPVRRPGGSAYRKAKVLGLPTVALRRGGGAALTTAAGGASGASGGGGSDAAASEGNGGAGGGDDGPDDVTAGAPPHAFSLNPAETLPEFSLTPQQMQAMQMMLGQAAGGAATGVGADNEQVAAAFVHAMQQVAMEQQQQQQQVAMEQMYSQQLQAQAMQNAVLQAMQQAQAQQQQHAPAAPAPPTDEPGDGGN
ncbi:nuclear factor related to kappa-B-binding protein [Pycnococcus provasolii]